MKTKTKAKQLSSDVVLHVRIEKEMWEILTQSAIENERTLAGEVRVCLRRYLGLGYHEAAQHNVQPTADTAKTTDKNHSGG